MQKTLAYFEICLALSFTVTLGGCASQNRPKSERGIPTQVEGTVTSMKGSVLVVTSDWGKTNVAIKKTTSLTKAETATIADITVGEWLESHGGRINDSPTIQADSILISDEKPSNDRGGDLRIGSHGGPGGGGPGGEVSEAGFGAQFQRSPGYRGIVDSIDGNKVAILMSDFGKIARVSIIVGPDTTILKLTPTTIDAIWAGTRVTVIGERNDDTLVARSIEIKQ